MDHYDAIVIGSGQGGTPLSIALAEAGRKTALVERQHVGGTCINVGCTPTKTMVASARIAYLVRRGADYGVRCGPVDVDLTKVHQRKESVVLDFRAGEVRRLERARTELILGEAHFAGPKAVEVRLTAGGTRALTADTIFINAGARPARPHVAGLDSVTALDSTSIMELQELPEHLLVLGGGYVGLEFGQMFRRFGSAVTIVQHGKQLLSREDPDVAAEVYKLLEADGIEILLETEAAGVHASASGVALDLRGPTGERTITGSHLLIAVGRVPNSEQLNLAAAGVKVDARGFIPVDDRLQTNVAGIYAMGDVKGGPAFTHISYDDYRIIRNNLLRGGQSSTRGRLVPYVVYIDPQLGRIGLSEQEARAQGRAIRVAKIPMAWVARAVEKAETRGFLKAVVDAETRQILGAAVLAVEGGEIMSMLQIAMMGKLPYTALQDGIFAHPAFAEGLNTLFTSLDKYQ
ncbi:MAG TPA: mercuric reductase [Tepidisphaeraceae bacterium]|jgi:pyruvate/2-oxoglutarate dehydrogenase complex dihydrolipoamide dehydrogenase (E3) component|nr:mercuric reductase [Tepidisphaeraceae bacterium]